MDNSLRSHEAQAIRFEDEGSAAPTSLQMHTTTEPEDDQTIAHGNAIHEMW